jgi:hypothetical protein
MLEALPPPRLRPCNFLFVEVKDEFVDEQFLYKIVKVFLTHPGITAHVIMCDSFFKVMSSSDFVYQFVIQNFPCI